MESPEENGVGYQTGWREAGEQQQIMPGILATLGLASLGFHNLESMKRWHPVMFSYLPNMLETLSTNECHLKSQRLNLKITKTLVSVLLDVYLSHSYSESCYFSFLSIFHLISEFLKNTDKTREFSVCFTFHITFTQIKEILFFQM